MTAALKLQHKIPVEVYLEQEKYSDIRHEYVAGDIYAMAGASEKHNLISGSIFAALRQHLRGKPCKTFINDMKLKLWAHLQVFYYPDVMVACEPEDTDPYFKTQPRVIVEVISDSTRNTDTREKLIIYFQVPTLQEYVLVEQDVMKVIVHRKSNEWRPEELVGADATLHLSSLGFSMSLNDIYEGVTFA